MFRITEYGLTSDEGFSVETPDRETVQYREGDHILTLQREAIVPSGSFLYFKNVRVWDAPHNEEKIDATDKERIRANLKKVYAFEKSNLEFDDEPFEHN